MKADPQDKFIDQPLARGLLLVRKPTGELYTNVPHLVSHHSPAGYEWGYSGSGPADLALNIVENLLREMNWNGFVMDSPMADGYRVFAASWGLHQPFKEEFIAKLPQEPGAYELNYLNCCFWIGEEIKKRGFDLNL